MRTRVVLTIVLLILIVITISSCFPPPAHRYIDEDDIDDVVNNLLQVKGEDDDMKGGMALMEIEIVESPSDNPYFLVQNLSGDDIFKVEHTSNTYVFYKFCFNASCSVFDYFNGSCLIRNVSGTILEVCG